MTRVFFRAADPNDDYDNVRLLYKGTVRLTPYGVVIEDGGELSQYGEPDTRMEQETTDLVPWHRVDLVEGVS